MDYSIILSQINSNQLEILSMLSSIKDCVQGIFVLLGICFMCVFIRNILKHR